MPLARCLLYKTILQNKHRISRTKGGEPRLCGCIRKSGLASRLATHTTPLLSSNTYCPTRIQPSHHRRLVRGCPCSIHHTWSLSPSPVTCTPTRSIMSPLADAHTVIRCRQLHGQWRPHTRRALSAEALCPLTASCICRSAAHTPELSFLHNCGLVSPMLQINCPTASACFISDHREQ